MGWDGLGQGELSLINGRVNKQSNIGRVGWISWAWAKFDSPITQQCIDKITL